MSLTKVGFDLAFTKPLDASAVRAFGVVQVTDGASSESRPTVAAPPFNMQSYTYNYWSTYGSPEIDRRVEVVRRVTVSGDRRLASLVLDNLQTGRVYELNVGGIRSDEGDLLVHTEAYYTLNELRK